MWDNRILLYLRWLVFVLLLVAVTAANSWTTGKKVRNRLSNILHNISVCRHFLLESFAIIIYLAFVYADIIYKSLAINFIHVLLLYIITILIYLIHNIMFQMCVRSMVAYRGQTGVCAQSRSDYTPSPQSWGTRMAASVGCDWSTVTILLLVATGSQWRMTGYAQPTSYLVGQPTRILIQW